MSKTPMSDAPMSKVPRRLESLLTRVITSSLMLAGVSLTVLAVIGASRRQ